jgi:hypothetical protein
MEKTDCSETSGYNIQTLGKHPKERIQNGIYFTNILLNIILFNTVEVCIILGKAVPKPTHSIVAKVYRGLLQLF